MSIVAAWLLTVAVHGVVLLLLAWSIDRSVPSLRGAWRELLWRTALFGCVLTATLQILSQQAPLGGRWNVAAEPALAVAAVAAPAARAPSARAGLVVPSQTLRVINEPAPPAATSIAPGSAETQAQGRSRLAWIVGVWLAGALFLVGRTTLSLLRLRRTLAAAAVVSNRTLESDLAVLAAQAGIAEPKLLQLDAIPSPIAAPFARIVLPGWAIDTLDQQQLQAMLAHELAHVVRGDAAWKLLTAYWRALFWFVPLNVVAQRRLDEIAELACDAFAARHTGSGRRLAECLAACAEHQVLGYTPELAPAMAARQSSLLYRIERLLEGVTMESATSASCARARGVALFALVVAAGSLPAIGFDSGAAHAAPAPAAAAQPAPPRKTVAKSNEDHTSISIHEDNSVINGSLNGHDMTSISMSDDAHKFRAKVDGKIDINAAENDIASLSAGGTAKFEETRAGVTRRIELASRADKLERRYFVNGAEKPFDDDARTFMAAAVLELVRSGIGAEARVKRLFASGGAKAVLDEIDQIHSDYVRSLYLKLLAGTGKLSSAELDRAIQIAGAMQSDYERRQALSALFETQTLDAARQVTFLHQSLHFESDYERAELLVGVEPRLVDSAEVRQAWLDAALGVQSDYERRRTLQAMLTGDRLDDAQLARVIQASASMGSDYEHRELLVAAVQQARDVNALAPAYTRAAQGIKSDYEHKEALLALIASGKLAASGAEAVLASAAQIHSSYECREVLVALARAMPKDTSLIAHYKDVASHLPDYDRSEAEGALAQ